VPASEDPATGGRGSIPIRGLAWGCQVSRCAIMKRTIALDRQLCYGYPKLRGKDPIGDLLSCTDSLCQDLIAEKHVSIL